ncbi:MAG: transporter substrate-binding domain-containing protein [Bifidobacterium adolescentis]
MTSYFAEQSRQGSGREGQSTRPSIRPPVWTCSPPTRWIITLANFTVTDERKEKVDFAKPYMKVALGVVSPESAEITDVSQLKGKTLIIAKGTTAET